MYITIPNFVLCLRLFEQRCIRIMDEMYKEDMKHAVKAMNDKALIWGVKSSPLMIAYENCMYDVVGHICSQKYMNIQWYNKFPPQFFLFLKVRVTTFSKRLCHRISF